MPLLFPVLGTTPSEDIREKKFRGKIRTHTRDLRSTKCIILCEAPLDSGLTRQAGCPASYFLGFLLFFPTF